METIEPFGPEWGTPAGALSWVLKHTKFVPWDDPRETLSIIPLGSNTAKGELGSSGRVRLKWDDGQELFSGRLEELARDRGGYWFGSVSPSARGEIVKAAKSALQELAGELARLVAAGELEAGGRMNSPLAPITVLSRDVWRYLTTDDWEGAVFTGPNGVTVYSMHLRRPGKAAPQVAEPKRRNREMELSEMMRQSLPRGSVEALTAKELRLQLAKPWHERFSGAQFPSDSTVNRARTKALQDWPKIPASDNPTHP